MNKIKLSHLFIITVLPTSKKKTKIEYITTIRINGVIIETIIEAKAAKSTNVGLRAAHNEFPANAKISN